MSDQMSKRLKAMGLAAPQRRTLTQDRALARALRRSVGGAFGTLAGMDRWADYALGSNGKTRKRTVRRRS